MSRSFGTEMSGISFRGLAGASAGGVCSWGWDVSESGIRIVYTPLGLDDSLFESFQRRLLGKFGGASRAGHKINGLANRHRGPKIKLHAAMLACGTGDVLKPVGHVRLRPQIKIHVGIHRECVPAFQAHCPTFAVRLDGSAIDPEIIRLANSATHLLQAFLHFLDIWLVHHWRRPAVIGFGNRRCRMSKYNGDMREEATYDEQRNDFLDAQERDPILPVPCT